MLEQVLSSAAAATLTAIASLLIRRYGDALLKKIEKSVGRRRRRSFKSHLKRRAGTIMEAAE